MLFRSHNIHFVEADLHALPRNLGSKDLVVISQSLHHLEDPNAVLGEAHRLLKPRGKIVVLELMPHLETWVRERLGHCHLGFDPNGLTEALEATGFTHLTQQTPAREGLQAFRVFLLTGVKS